MSETGWGLRQCPFCGADAVLETCTTALEKVSRYRVRCKEQCSETSWDNWSEGEAARKWNRREETQEAKLLSMQDACMLIGLPRYAEYIVDVNGELFLQSGYALVQTFADKGFDDEHFVSFATSTGIKTYHIAAYGKSWRMWDKNPTDEQREAVKWE